MIKYTHWIWKITNTQFFTQSCVSLVVFYSSYHKVLQLQMTATKIRNEKIEQNKKQNYEHDSQNGHCCLWFAMPKSLQHDSLMLQTCRHNYWS